MMRCAALASCLLVLALVWGQSGFRPAPAVVIEAEDFLVEDGWKVVRNGEGNYMVDLVGFNHISGERLLSLPAEVKSGTANAVVDIPEAGSYRLWVRYEYPPFTDARFRVVVEQNGKQLLDQLMGTKDSVRYAAFSGKYEAKAQHDPPWGPEGLLEEVVTIAALKKGKATLKLLGVEQPQEPGRSANRNIDLLYLTRDVGDSWIKHYSQRTSAYPILDAVRDAIGPRWEARFTNRGTKNASFRVSHVYNRIPWSHSDPAEVGDLAPGSSSDWLGLGGQDTTHFGAVQFLSTGEPFELELRPVGATTVTRKLAGPSPLRVYLPPYPNKGEEPTTPEEAIDRILAELKKHPAPGKNPTLPLCHGGWMPLGQDNAYGRKYAELYVALGFRGMHPANSGPVQRKNLEALGLKPSRSWMVTSYRHPPTRANIDRAKGQLLRDGLLDQLRFFDYGDEIHFSEWIDMLLAEDLAKDKRLKPSEALSQRWIAWLKKHRADRPLKDYWLPEWGVVGTTPLRPDSSANAAVKNPRLYVDSLLFYEDIAIEFAAQGVKEVRAALGEEVLCGANYSCHPFYYPQTTMYIKWFRRGAADLGRHSEYFWQLAQLGPMVNGYISEHFRSGMRENPRAILRQYNMPHAPGNTDANFQRSAFTHLAHGATMLDFFGIGLNETFTENHIDHRAVSRYRALRDVTHCVGFVEDLLPQARAVPSSVALLVSESTERWDFAAIALDRAGHAVFGPKFRQTRLHFHLERLGIWKALTFLGYSPDLVTEEDVLAGKLSDKKVLIVVGDHWPRELVPALKTWVEAGGVLLGTAASGQKDSYGEPMTDWHQLAGLKRVTTRQRETFLRPRQELAFLEPLDRLAGRGPWMPILATQERIEPSDDVEIRARFASDNSPAYVARRLGKGKIYYLAGHPGLAYLWLLARPPRVPDRGPNTHALPGPLDPAVFHLPGADIAEAAGPPRLSVSGTVDARLLEAPTGYVLPLANYAPGPLKSVELVLRDLPTIRRVASAYHGELTFTAQDKTLRVTLPSLTYGDVLRLDK